MQNRVIGLEHFAMDLFSIFVDSLIENHFTNLLTLLTNLVTLPTNLLTLTTNLVTLPTNLVTLTTNLVTYQPTYQPR